MAPKEYLTMVNEYGLEIIDFGYTWQRIPKNGTVFRSAIDHGMINKPSFIHEYYQTDVDYSDHNMICVKLNVKTPKSRENIITSRDLKKLRSNPKFFLKKISRNQLGMFQRYGRYK